ncbi:YeeE/YedE family protein [Hyphomicrobium sp.]|uniref:YeeE/YedE family protein n=1 Tax=Hyphomicrobium sp. TaxID=82 RepID=UPI001D315DC5|nr:YeeE/YedE family protein [Hyphomicrobium sp.]MBY0559619.1 YeeE/YedE family protein [Hyphomicrobium sp.]
MPGFPQAAPVEGLVGGLLIGLAAAIMLLGNGRIAGVSGLFARALGISPGQTPRQLALAFIIGLPIGAGLVELVVGVNANFPAPAYLLIAGAIVGFGTQLGSGCTSGHGICGLSRLSKRSIFATLTFMSAGVITVTMMRLLGLSP